MLTFFDIGVVKLYQQQIECVRDQLLHIVDLMQELKNEQWNISRVNGLAKRLSLPGDDGELQNARVDASNPVRALKQVSRSGRQFPLEVGESSSVLLLTSSNA